MKYLSILIDMYYTNMEKIGYVYQKVEKIDQHSIVLCYPIWRENTFVWIMPKFNP
jgi:hypothetical protein